MNLIRMVESFTYGWSEMVKERQQRKSKKNIYSKHFNVIKARRYGKALLFSSSLEYDDIIRPEHLKLMKKKQQRRI